jgi:hypothetical protein
MEWRAWQPYYRRIVASFGYSTAADRRSARSLADGLSPPDVSRARTSLERRLAGADVVVAGDGPSLEAELDGVVGDETSVVAADGAVARLRDAGVEVDVAVTDLDGAPEACAELSRDGAPVALHAHGDNASLIDEWLPRFDHDAVVGTTQCRPERGLANHGGFTDGDRAAFLADAMGARRIALAGFDLHDPTVEREKRRKLRWAELLLRLLEDRRGERLLA